MFRVLLAILATPLIAQNPLTPAEERGKQIFERGTTTSGTSIQAVIAGDARVAGSILPCANCHGHNGRGKPEGGVVPSDITWNALTKPYGVSHPNGRTHPPYTERLFKRAITMGLDPAGNSLSDAMPRFQLSLADASDLVAYIKRLGDASDPGLTATTVRLGVILAPAQKATAGPVVKQALLDYFTPLNAAGGIFGRRIEIVFTELPQEHTRRAEAVLDFLGHENIFALVSASFEGAESEIARVTSMTGTPAVVAFAPIPQTATPLNRYAFYLDGGLREELDGLLRFATDKFPGNTRPLVIVSPNDENLREITNWLRGHLAESGYRQVTVTEESPQPAPGTLVFWLRPDLGALPAGVETVLIPGSLLAMSSTIPIKGNSRVFIAVGSGWSGEEITPTRLTWERATASAEIVTEAMSRAGRNLTRETLIEALEGFYNVQTNLPTPFTFGPNRRIGANNVRIMTLDNQTGKLIRIQPDTRAP